MYWQARSSLQDGNKTGILSLEGQENEEPFTLTEDEIESPCIARLGSEEHQTMDMFGGCNEHAAIPRDWRAPTLQIGSSAGLAHSITSLDGYVLDYYDRFVCSNATLFDGETHNPLRYLILPMATSSPIILAAVLAVGATKLAHKDARFRHRALIYRQRVLTDLNHSLPHVHSTLTGFLEAMVTAVMLCWYDVSSLFLSCSAGHEQIFMH